jgi:hypothetical protein
MTQYLALGFNIANYGHLVVGRFTKKFFPE